MITVRNENDIILADLEDHSSITLELSSGDRVRINESKDGGIIVSHVYRLPSEMMIHPLSGNVVEMCFKPTR